MAKHRKVAKHGKRKTTRAGSAALAGATAAGISTALVFSHATNTTPDIAQVQLANTVIGVGGWRDSQSARIPQKLNGKLVPPGYTYLPVSYPANLPVDPSVAEGVPALQQAIVATSGLKLVASYSEGTIVAELEKRNLAANPATAPSRSELSFLFIAAPFVPNGGIYARFPGISLPGFASTGPAEPTQYNSQYVTLEYDPVGDFPAYFNPLSLANALAGLFYVHGDPSPDALDLSVTPGISKTVQNSAGGTDTYILVPAAHIPLLEPVRQVTTLLQLSPVAEPILGAIEPTLRVLIDMGYTDRQNLNPEVPTSFSLITPPANVLEALAALPGAIAQGEQNLLNGGAPATSTPAPSGTVQLAAVSAQPKVTAPAKAPSTSTGSTTTPAGPTTTAATTSVTKTAVIDHPTVTSAGNKVTPKASTSTADAGSSTVAGDGTSKNQQSTPTASTPTPSTAGSATGGTGASPAGNGTSSGASSSGTH